LQVQIGRDFLAVRVGGDDELELVLRLGVAEDLQVDCGNAGAAVRQVTTRVEGGDDDAVVHQGRRVIVGSFLERRMLAALDANDLDLAFVVGFPKR